MDILLRAEADPNAQDHVSELMMNYLFFGRKQKKEEREKEEQEEEQTTNERRAEKKSFLAKSKEKKVKREKIERRYQVEKMIHHLFFRETCLSLNLE